MSTVQVGFSPAAGNSVITAGVAAGAVAAASGGDPDAAASPLGFLGALLDILSQGLDLPALEQPPGNGQPQAGIPPAPPIFTPAPLPLGVPEVTVKGEPGKRQLGEDGQKLLSDLVAALAAIDAAAEAGQPVDPALEKKLSSTLDELAGMLGITLPAPPAIDPAITEAAAGPAAAPLLEPGEAPLPAPLAPPAGTAGAPDAAGGERLAEDFAAAVKAATVAPPPQDEAVTETVKVTPTESQPAAPQPPAAEGETPPPATPETRLAALVEKLTAMADRLETRLPAVAEKLQKLADKLTLADDETLARLAARLEDADLATLVATRPADKPAPAPQPLAQPVLPTPTAALADAAGEVASKPAEKTAELPASKPTVDEAPEAPRPMAEAKPVDRPLEKPDTETRRADFAQHLADVRGEKLADAAEQSQPSQTAIAAPGRSEVVPKAVHAAYQAPVQQVNLPQVAFEVVRQFNQGNSRFQIRLDPPELGRIDVRMQIDSEGNLQARMTVERAETLDLMQRDQRQLEKALAQAGLDTSKTSLEFSLRQNPQGRDGQPFQQFNQQHQQGSQQAPWQQRGAAEAELAEITTTQYSGLASPSGVNLFV